ncbi:MAG: hypothetical protein ACOYI4_09100 [Christensenellales bacterium]|jgi:hypothetical protein
MDTKPTQTTLPEEKPPSGLKVSPLTGRPYFDEEEVDNYYMNKWATELMSEAKQQK